MRKRTRSVGISCVFIKPSLDGVGNSEAQLQTHALIEDPSYPIDSNRKRITRDASGHTRVQERGAVGRFGNIKARHQRTALRQPTSCPNFFFLRAFGHLIAINLLAIDE